MLNELKLRRKITIFEHTRFYTKISVIKKNIYIESVFINGSVRGRSR